MAAKDSIAGIYETLLASNRISISFPARADFNSFYAQLRTVKSRYETKFNTTFNESLSNGRVIRYIELSPLQYEFYLGEPIQRSETRFKILNVVHNANSANIIKDSENHSD